MSHTVTVLSNAIKISLFEIYAYIRTERQLVCRNKVAVDTEVTCGRAVCRQKTVGSTFVTGEVVVRSCEVQAGCVEGSTGVSGTASANTYCCKDNLCNGAVKPGNQLPLAVALLVGVAVAARLF